MKKLIVVCMVVGLLFFGYSHRDKIEGLMVKEKVLKMEDSLIRRDGSKYKICDGGVISLGQGDLTMERLNSEEEDRHLLLDLEEGFLELGQEHIYVVNKGDGEVYIIDMNLEVEERVPLAKEIFNVKESQGSLIYHIKEEGMETLGIINKKGHQIAKYDYAETVLDYTIDPNNSKMAVGLLTENEGMLESIIKIQDNSDEVRTLYLNDEVVMGMEFITKDDLIVLTDKKVYSIGHDEIKWTKNYNLIKDMKVKSKDIYILYGRKLDVINYRGDIIREVTLDREYSNMDFIELNKLDTDIILYDESGLDILGKSGDYHLRWEGPIEKLKSKGSKVFILDGEKIGRYGLTYEEVEESDEEGEKDSGTIKNSIKELFNRFRKQAEPNN